MATTRPNIGINIAGPDAAAVKAASTSVIDVLKAGHGNDQETIRKALDVLSGMTNKPVSIVDSSVSMGVGEAAK